MRPLLPLLLAACTTSDVRTDPAASDGFGTLRIQLHDAPTDDVDAVWVSWGEVRVRHVDHGWTTVSTAPGQVDLLTLQGGTQTDLGLASVPVGAYDEVRFELTDAWVIVDGVREPLSVPSGESSGLKVKIDFAVEDCGDTSVSLDWDVGAQLNHNPQGFSLRPVLLADATYDDTACDLCAGDIVFPDPALEAAMRVELGIPTGPITAEDARGPGSRFLFLQNLGIADLTGLQCVAGGEHYLNLTGNPVTDLSPLAALPALNVLYLTNTPVQDLTPIAGLTEMLDLRIDRTQVDDLSPIRGMDQLLIFSAISMSLADWSPVSGLASLEILIVRSSSFSDLGLLHPDAPFRTLAANDSDIADLSALAGRTTLERLEVSSSPVSDLSPVYGLPALVDVTVNRTAVADLAGLDLPAVRSLDIGRTSIVDLGPLVGAPVVESVSFRSLAASDYTPLTSLPALQRVDATGSTLDCSGPVAADLVSSGVTVVGCP